MLDETTNEDRDETATPDEQVDFYDPWQQAFREELTRRQQEFEF